MHVIGILLALAVFAFAAFALFRFTGRPAQPSRNDALEAFAAANGSRVERQVVGFGRQVRFHAGGWPLTFRAHVTEAGAIDMMGASARLNAYGEFRSLRPFRLELNPRGADGLVVAANRPPVIPAGLFPGDAAYEVRSDDAALAARLLTDPAVSAALRAAARPSSSLYVGPRTEGLLKRSRPGAGAVAFNEDEEPLTRERLEAIRDMIAAVLDALVKQGVAERA
jgi:hypothetical protein